MLRSPVSPNGLSGMADNCPRFRPWYGQAARPASFPCWGTFAGPAYVASYSAVVLIAVIDGDVLLGRVGLVGVERQSAAFRPDCFAVFFHQVACLLLRVGGGLLDVHLAQLAALLASLVAAPVLATPLAAIPLLLAPLPVTPRRSGSRGSVTVARGASAGSPGAIGMGPVSVWSVSGPLATLAPWPTD